MIRVVGVEPRLTPNKNIETEVYKFDIAYVLWAIRP